MNEENLIDKSDLLGVIESVRNFTERNVKPSRYEHSLRTAGMCKKLSSLFSLDQDLAYLSGIAHDMCKSFEDDKLIFLSSKDGDELTELETNKPGLLHGRAAAVLLETMFSFHDKRIVEAVKVHTFGKVGMGDYAKVLFVADKIEPGRSHITKEYLEEIYKLSLNQMCLKVVSESVDYLMKKGKSVAPETLKVLEWLKEIS